MGAFGGLILTNKGKVLQAKAQAGAPLIYTRFGIGDGQIGSTAIADLSALKNQIMSLELTKIVVQNNSRAVVGSVLKNSSLLNGFYFRELGLFATDPDAGEILYCYANAGVLAEYIPAGGGADVVEKSIDVQVITGNAANVSALIDSSLIYITESEKGSPGGVAPLDSSGHVPSKHLNFDTSKLATKIELTEHTDEDVSEAEVHGMRVTNGKFEFLDGADWKQVGGGEAAEVLIEDPGNYYSSTDVNGALQEIGQAFNGLRGNIIASVNAIAQM